MSMCLCLIWMMSPSKSQVLCFVKRLDQISRGQAVQSCKWKQQNDA